MSKGREELRKELGRAQKHEIKTHQELQFALSERIADKERVIADLWAQLDRDASTRGEASGGDEPTRVKTGRTLKLPALPVFDGGDKVDDGAYKQLLAKLEKHAELLHWSDREKLLQFELHLTGKVKSIYEVLPPEEKATFTLASEALGKRVQPAKREALTSAQLLRRRQKPGKGVDDFTREYEWLFEESYGHRVDVDATFKGVLKQEIFVQGLLLKW